MNKNVGDTFSVILIFLAFWQVRMERRCCMEHQMAKWVLYKWIGESCQNKSPQNPKWINSPTYSWSHADLSQRQKHVVPTVKLSYSIISKSMKNQSYWQNIKTIIHALIGTIYKSQVYLFVFVFLHFQIPFFYDTFNISWESLNC